MKEKARKDYEETCSFLRGMMRKNVETLSKTMSEEMTVEDLRKYAMMVKILMDIDPEYREKRRPPGEGEEEKTKWDTNREKKLAEAMKEIMQETMMKGDGDALKDYSKMTAEIKDRELLGKQEEAESD